MFKGDFASAETVLHDIIEVDKDYTLLSDYGMNWRTEYENSSESVFEIANKVYDKNIAQVPMSLTSSQADASPVIKDMDFTSNPRSP